MPQIIDISQTLIPGMAVWPGDTEFKTFWTARIADGASCNVGSATMSLHTGTHVDAPLHSLPEGQSIADTDLSVYVGPAQVIDMVGISVIEAEHVLPLAPGLPKRVLFKTRLSPAAHHDPEFTYLSPAAARILVDFGIKLVGIESPSVDSGHSETTETHKILASAGIAILENLSMGNVAPGLYELIALPLKLAGMDGSPVRAVLRTL